MMVAGQRSPGVIRALIGAAALGWHVLAKPNCLEDAAAYHGVNAAVLKAIAWNESAGNPDAVNHNRNGTVDIGLMQINSIHLQTLSRHGIHTDTLRDPCVAAYVGAWLYRQQIDQYGNTWAAVGAYHSRTPALRDRYAANVRRTLQRWGVIAH